MPEVTEILGYEVIETLGRGAKSTIYAVRDAAGEVFALKRVEKSDPSDQRFVDQAVAEHEIANKLDHPLLRKSYKLFRNRSFIRTTGVVVVMELVNGQTLEQLKQGPVGDITEICRKVSQGLGAMHQAGFVHSDMKPNNVLVTPQGGVKIIDLGQSCKVGTVKQRIQGTPDYIAPEQVLKRAITPQTDVFNLGATMYWLLTGKHVPTLIPRGKPGMTLRTERRPAPPIELNPQVSPALSSVVMDCIATRADERPRTMAEVDGRLEIALAQIRRKEGGGDPAGQPIRRMEQDVDDESESVCERLNPVEDISLRRSAG